MSECHCQTPAKMGQDANDHQAQQTSRKCQIPDISTGFQQTHWCPNRSLSVLNTSCHSDSVMRNDNSRVSYPVAEIVPQQRHVKCFSSLTTRSRRPACPRLQHHRLCKNPVEALTRGARVHRSSTPWTASASTLAQRNQSATSPKKETQFNSAGSSDQHEACEVWRRLRGGRLATSNC